MNQERADALVFYGATGDLAQKKIFPALQALAQRNNLDIPPSLFATVIQKLANSACAEGARIVIEKPFGQDLATAKTLNGGWADNGGYRPPVQPGR